MATDNIISLHAPRKSPKSDAERARAYRARRRAKQAGSVPVQALPAQDVARLEHAEPRLAVRADQVLVKSEGARTRRQPNALAVRADIDPQQVQLGLGEISHPATIAAPVTPVTSRPVTSPVTPSRWPASSIALSGAAFSLAGVGIVMNGWFARSLGATDIAGWLFLAVGVASDCAALAVPSCTARLWNAHKRASAVVGWLVWVATFAFALSASIGFASVNISDVTASRASRVTLAVTAAQAQLADAQAARDRECKSGAGKFCRDREQTVNQRTQALDAAMASVAEAADPQTQSAIKAVTFLTGGALRPTADDFALVRLLLLAFLPQVGGILLMLARGGR